MSSLSDFNSLWEVSFAVNAIFIFFDYSEHHGKQLKKILEIGEMELKYHFSETKEQIGGWSYSNALNKWFPVRYHLQMNTLKVFGVVNTILSTKLLIISAYFPTTNFWIIFSVPLLLILLGPIAYNVVNIHYVFPKAIISSIEDILGERLKKDKDKLDDEDYKKEKIRAERAMFEIKSRYTYLYFPGPKIPDSYFEDIK